MNGIRKRIGICHKMITQDYFIDLVFYNCYLNFYINLKINKVMYQDIE